MIEISQPYSFSPFISIFTIFSLLINDHFFKKMGVNCVIVRATHKLQAEFYFLNDKIFWFNSIKV